ncbi:hypothetical protein BSL78_22994 [Apostichopus japonicus]|uniref:Uncharacterized protein n=1 Tax=Stichopus japonicus TaxID=307972 RepID=A0A2G8JWN3_STIJA|nr:hypothetical protein BSL78_22994 [Apostichopus japonicus]
MDWLYVILTLTLATNSLVQSFSLIPTTTEEATVGYEYNYFSYPNYGPRPTKEATVEHEYNSYNYPNYGPRISPPFSNPGEIVEGLTVEEVVLAFGYGWNADNLLKSASIACDTLGSDLSALIERTGQPGIVGDVCKTFETSNVEEGCNGLWDLVTNGKEGSFSLVPGMRCRERSDDYYNYGYGYNFNLTDYVYTTFGEAEDFNVTDYTTFVEAEEEVLAMIGDFNPYDPCSETGNKKVNNIVFALMDWLGPSVYSNIYQREVEPYSVCGILRYLFSIDVIDYVTQVITISSYPAADILESFQTVDICAISQIDFEGTIAIRVAKELLVEYSELKESEFCDFIAKPQTREAYLELGATIVINAFHTLVVEETCNNVLTIIAPLDKEGIHVDITGFNLTIASERAMFCAKASQAYSPNSGYVPIPYKLPEGVELDDWRPFEIPGVFLPGLTFIDLLEIEGASYHADKIIDGTGDILLQFQISFRVIEDDTFHVKGLCDALKPKHCLY